MRNNKSFTLIELLVVIVIIGILAGVIMISTSSSIDKANFAKAKAFSSTVQNELLSNLVSEWTFDNVSNIGEDTWGNNHGTLYNFANPATPTSGLASANECVFGTCLKFDGVDDYVEILNDGLNSSLSSFSISVWVKAVKVADYAYIIHRSETAAIGTSVYWLGINNLDNYASAVNGRYSVGGTKIAANQNNWRFMVLSYDGQVQRTYVDGNLEVLDANVGLITNNKDANKITFGSTAHQINYRPLKGLIDDIRIYDTTLSSSEIKQNYIAGLNSMLANGNISKEGYNERINNLAYNDNNE